MIGQTTSLFGRSTSTKCKRTGWVRALTHWVPLRLYPNSTLFWWNSTYFDEMVPCLV